MKAIVIRPYNTQSGSIEGVAPKNKDTGRMTNIPPILRKSPRIMVNKINIVKVWFALSFFPHPSSIATRALPPVPIINPIPPRIITNGMTRFRAAKGVLPTKSDTNRPSITPYIEVKIIIIIVGNTKRSNF